MPTDDDSGEADQSLAVRYSRESESNVARNFATHRLIADTPTLNTVSVVRLKETQLGGDFVGLACYTDIEE
ncbi:hypothetical protein CH275_16490 [Rhodococcus sp. 06-235-1A]|nr:hypothetical protein CH275_16490 [Rhodococcus sp. 06-235-1A]